MTQKTDPTEFGQTTGKTAHSGGDDSTYMESYMVSGNTTGKTALSPGDDIITMDRNMGFGNGTAQMTLPTVKNITSTSNEKKS
jgi:hypothetical protein